MITDHSQLYSDVTHCVDTLVETMTEEISEAVIDLVLDGRIALSGFFKRNGMVDDGCEQHVFFSSYQADILKRVERNLSRKGFTCRIHITGKGKGQHRYIAYTTRVPHPLKKLVALVTILVLPILTLAAGLHYVAGQALLRQVKVAGESQHPRTDLIVNRRSFVWQDQRDRERERRTAIRLNRQSIYERNSTEL